MEIYAGNWSSLSFVLGPWTSATPQMGWTWTRVLAARDRRAGTSSRTPGLRAETVGERGEGRGRHVSVTR